MAVDAFLQFTSTGDGAPELIGETQDQQMKAMSPAPFEISDWGLSVSLPVSIGSSKAGGGTGKAKFEPFRVTKNIDSASPNLFYTCCVGGHYKELNLFVRRAGGTPSQSGQTYLQIGFKLVMVSNIQWSNGEVPTETISFDYGALQFKYTAQKQTGGLGEAATTQWSQVTNSADYDAAI